MKNNRSDRATTLSSLYLLLFVILLSLSSCARSTGYESLPAYPVEAFQKEIVAHYLDTGAAIEAFDLQAHSVIEDGLAAYWHPQYLATAVIAIDRDKTSVHINGWNDLRRVPEKVGFNNANLHAEMLILAMAYGLEGEDFTIRQAAELWFTLQAENRLEADSFAAPVIVCYDYQAVAQNKNGRNLEIVVPTEGTLTYEKGLLTNREFSIEHDLDAFYLAEGFRLLDGRGDPTLYPDAAAYENAVRITDYEHASDVYTEATGVLRRNVLYTRLNTAADLPEYQLIVLLYCIIVIVWLASVMRRAMHRQVRRAALLTGILLLGWITTRLISYQISVATDLSRYLWYGYYLFQLMIPLLFVWLASLIDRADKQKLMPKRQLLLAAYNAAMVVLVMTNDLHKLVFRMDLHYPNWSSEYGYGAGFYLVMAGSIVPLITGLVIMLLKAKRSPRRLGFVLPLACAGLLAAYGAGYVLRIPAAWESDAAMVIGILTLLFFEAALRTGLIPVNTKYAALFARSPLSMQIVDSSGKAALSSEYAERRDKAMYESVRPPYQPSIQYDEDTLLFAAGIVGGTVFWKEDIANLNRLHKEIEESIRKLQAANALLAEEERVKREIGEEKARTILLTQLEAEIARHTGRLNAMMARLKGADDIMAGAARIAPLLCYIKRRCNLFFRERETAELPAEEIKSYLEELSELAAEVGTRSIVSCELKAPLPVRSATLFYDFFYQVLDWASTLNNTYLLAQLEYANDTAAMRLTLPEDARSFRLDEAMNAAIASAGGVYTAKDIDDAVGLSLVFKGGWV